MVHLWAEMNCGYATTSSYENRLAMTIHILFVCTGNTCRSQMAQAMAEQIIAQQRWPFECTSAGIRATTGAPTTPEAVDVLSELGINWQGTSQQLSVELLQQADVVWVMADEHRQVAQQLSASLALPQRPAITLLAQQEVPDPLDCGRPAYEQLQLFLQSLLPQRLKALALEPQA